MDFLILAISAFGLGALHVLEPGHGKTVMAAYLVGTKGQVRDAVILGVAATIAHTGSVLILGILATMAAFYIDPELVEKDFGIISGLLIIAIGIWMLKLRIGRTGKNTSHITIDHNDHQNHNHHHHPLPHFEPGQRPHLGQLIVLGISGGIIPCHSALAVLLAAVSFGQFAKALLLVIIHSIGMASVLVGIGIAMVKAADFAGKYVSENKWARYAPIASIVIVLLMGILMTVRSITLASHHG